MRSFQDIAPLALLALAAAAGCSSDPASPFGNSATAAGSGGASSSTGATSSGAAGGATTGGGGAGGDGMGNNGFPPHWDDGLACASAPPIQIWAYNDDTYILRQSLCTNFEGPFLYLLFGQDRVLLQDTGTGAVDVRSAVAGIIQSWLARNGKPSIELVVTHSHGHGDHVGGDGQFAGAPDTTLVGAGVSAVRSFFGIDPWPTEIVSYDLGGRTLDVLPIPGHQSAHIAVYDRRDRLLLTGDTLYPGRLYIDVWNDYRASVQRMVDFVEAGSPVEWVLGTHIELDKSGNDYPFGADQHPDEHALELPYAVLVELNQAVIAQGDTPVYEAHADFILYP
jgi:glyoxylase-like metal-dependent hydrolase (beta-lactamase superfamily II)